MQFVLVSIVIWQACDPFADAAQWVGQKTKTSWFRTGSHIGRDCQFHAGTLHRNFFFVIVATSGGSGEHVDGDGFGASLATCAGSAVYNMILIPAFCVLFISFSRPSRPTIDVEQEVISRDGLWFLAAEAVLIAFMFQDEMEWWMGFRTANALRRLYLAVVSRC